jgi:ankyrin repeat protein
MERVHRLEVVLLMSLVFSVAAAMWAFLCVLCGLVFWSRYGTSSVHRCSSRGDVVRLKKILEKMPKLVNSQDLWGLTPLQYAAAHGQIKSADVLLSMGAKCFPGIGWSPLQYAVCSRVPELVKRLLDRCEFENVVGCGFNGLLHVAIGNSTDEIVSLLLQQGISPNCQDGKGNSPLHVAALLGKENVTRMLLEYGANPQTHNSSYQTPLKLAEQAGYFSVAQMLRLRTESLYS